MNVIVLVPAHNEEETLPSTIKSLITQTVPPNRIVVVSDNSTDATSRIAQSWGRKVELFETVGNVDKKAGALNQALSHINPHDDDTILVVDADSTLVSTWIETATAWFENTKIGAIGGVFLSDGIRRGPLSFFETLEYERYAVEISKDNAKARVLTGTATMVPMRILREIEQARASGKISGRGIYDLAALTEDFSLTLAIKRLGYECYSPKECVVRTETMGSLSMFWKQRIRWQRGALEALHTYGVNRTTLPYIGKQIEIGIGLIAVMLLYMVSTWSVVTHTLSFEPFWLLLGIGMFVERLYSVWACGWKARWITLTILPDMVYDMIIGAVYVTVIFQILTKKESSWGTHNIEVA